MTVFAAPVRGTERLTVSCLQSGKGHPSPCGRCSRRLAGRSAIRGVVLSSVNDLVAEAVRPIMSVTAVATTMWLPPVRALRLSTLPNGDLVDEPICVLSS